MRKKVSKLWTIPVPELQGLANQSTSMSGILRRLGYSKTSAEQGSRLKWILKERGVNIDHFLSRAENISKFQRAQSDAQVMDWLAGKITAHSNASQHQVLVWARRYLMDKADNKCQLCGWGEVNQFTGLIPLHIHHVDGISTNSKPDNLMVVCPNCHSLTENFGSRNKKCTRNHKHRLTGV